MRAAACTQGVGSKGLSASRFLAAANALCRSPNTSGECLRQAGQVEQTSLMEAGMPDVPGGESTM
jgi:hypothetical protein